LRKVGAGEGLANAPADAGDEDDGRCGGHGG
jgi:hypothetical protein